MRAPDGCCASNSSGNGEDEDEDEDEDEGLWVGVGVFMVGDMGEEGFVAYSSW